MKPRENNQTALQPKLNAAFILSIACLAVFMLGTNTHADTNGKRQKAIDFDDDVVEGLNKRPLDSLSQVSERDKKHRKPHLYKTRGGFRPETEDSLRTAKVIP